VFVALVFAFGWSVWVPRALVSQGLLSARWPIAIGAYWTYMPSVAAVITAALTGRGALRELGARLVRWRVRWWWYLIVLLGPAAFWGVVYTMANLLGFAGELRQPPLLEQGLAAAVPLFLVLALTDGLGEEPGWRGFLCPTARAPYAIGGKLPAWGDLGRLAPAALLDPRCDVRWELAAAAGPRAAGGIDRLHLGVRAHEGKRSHRYPAARSVELVHSERGGRRRGLLAADHPGAPQQVAVSRSSCAGLGPSTSAPGRH
jgi:hypothetical protein